MPQCRRSVSHLSGTLFISSVARLYYTHLSTLQELWSMLHSASSNESGVPQQLLDAKQQELRERREREAAIQVLAYQQV